MVAGRPRRLRTTSRNALPCAVAGAVRPPRRHRCRKRARRSHPRLAADRSDSTAGGCVRRQVGARQQRATRAEQRLELRRRRPRPRRCPSPTTTVSSVPSRRTTMTRFRRCPTGCRSRSARSRPPGGAGRRRSAPPAAPARRPGPVPSNDQTPITSARSSTSRTRVTSRSSVAVHRDEAGQRLADAGRAVGEAAGLGGEGRVALVERQEAVEVAGVDAGDDRLRAPARAWRWT